MTRTPNVSESSKIPLEPFSVNVEHMTGSSEARDPRGASGFQRLGHARLYSGIPKKPKEVSAGNTRS